MSEDRGTDTAVALLLALAAIAAAAIGARAALLGDSGSDTWHRAVREDVRQGARIVGDVRLLYEEDAAVAHRVAEAQLVGEETRRAARGERGTVGSILEAEAEAQLGVANTLAGGSALADGDPLRTLRLRGRDLLERLVELRADTPPELAGLDPDATEEEGADQSRESSLLVASTIPVALAFLLGALAEALPGRRRGLVLAGFACVAAGIASAAVIEVLV
jgi:hypothetical protein